ncbi:MAG TPA: hypothetical protein VM933_08560 [Acidimicrobiales bacterium]|nr:hypothetical protein [Acidimicrobiales bacterium]
MCGLLFFGAAAMFVAERGHGGFEPPRRERPLTYRVLYRVEDRAGGGQRVFWEERTVARPFTGRTVTSDERPPPLVNARGNLTTHDRVFSIGEEGLREVSARVPGVSGSDQALAEVLDEAVIRGLARRIGAKRVAGRPCRVFRVAEPPVGPLQPIRPGNFADECIARDGLLLWERWTIDGRVVRVREAVELDLSLPGGGRPDALSTGGALGPVAGVAAPRRVRGEPVPTFLADPPAPKGFRSAGTTDLVVPLTLANPDAPADAVLYASRSWVFVRGPDVISVEAASGGLGWSESDPSSPVGLDGLGEARSVLGVDGSELRVDLGERGWVRIRGTVDPDRLADYADGVVLA